MSERIAYETVTPEQRLFATSSLKSMGYGNDQSDYRLIELPSFRFE
ncbi:hypothetical Protein YC6258_04597 [Gynuella sunshinyii YC6258]|uniref:Uncharacterized protein n=1 Tax=Gynuella sunshinyii YC6258 TaxID=1445510 RepID=A0A0C5W1S2_9GAMM|nr:hypothetical Protein YC6258_04597 [Gynuella sunshinyii YC6258]